MTDPLLQSPWHNLPTEPPYILPEDLEFIRHHRNFSNLRLDTLPGQFAGGLDTAEVVFLVLNPGYDERDTTLNLQLPKFLEANRNNHTDPYSSLFYYFNDGLETTSGYEWWARKLKPLIASGVSEDMLRKKIMLVEYFPYHSTRYKHITPSLPSQQFAFNLVYEATKRNKIIIVMRSKKLWLKAVPELASYPYMTLNSPQNVVISPKNLGEANFNSLVSKLKTL